MAAQKRKTLPKDFGEIIRSGDVAAWEAMYEKCEINAYGGVGGGNALTFDEIDEKFIRWAVGRGMDVNGKDRSYGEPPLFYHRYNPDIAAILIEMGAEVDWRGRDGATILSSTMQCPSMREQYLRFVKLLIDSGADVHAENDRGWTPLEVVLLHCQNISIPGVVAVAKLLLAAGAKIKPQMKERVRKIGETFEYIRPDFNTELVEEYSAALDELYGLFGVEPVPRRIVYDGVSPIRVKATRWQDQFEELWNLLVPPSGHAPTVQGEVVRIAGKVTREILDNGACNWSRDYKKLPQALPGYLAQGNTLEAPLAEEAVRLAKGIGAESDEEELYRLSELVVAWVLRNPEPIAMPERVDYKR